MKFNNQFNAHQGDVQIFSIDKLPAGLTKKPKTFFAKSEKSGHTHALCGDYELFEDEKTGNRYVKVGTDGATLNHTGYKNLTPEYWEKNKALPIADHKPTAIPPGVYFVGIQRRIDPFKSVWEKVQD